MQYIVYILHRIVYDVQYKEGQGLKNLKLKAARAILDMSQEQLAKAVSVTRQTIGMIEAGKFNPSLQLCVAICKALGKTLDEIFWEG